MGKMRIVAWRARRSAANSKAAASSSDELKDLLDSPVGSRTRGLDLDLRLREFEINQLTQRNNFFMIFQGVLIAGLVQSQGTAAPLITFSMSLLGVATSLLQVGMAGGAKYWQSRWEASTRSSEIAIVLELLKKDKLAVQTFTHDSSLLTPNERNDINNWNAAHPNPSDQITDDPKFIHEIVQADIQSNSKDGFRGLADVLVRRFAIEPKWSVSRIPIWVGIALLIFWMSITLHSVSAPALGLEKLEPSWIKLVPLKAEPSGK